MEESEMDGNHRSHHSGNKGHISRLSRKVNEKIRRDRLNGLIAELAEEVPTIKYAHRRLDKSSVLRLTVSFLKLHQGLRHKKRARTNIFNDRAIYNKVNMMNDGVMMVMTQSGLILYVSQSVKQIMGYHQSDIIGFNVARFVHPDDVAAFSLKSDFSDDDIDEAACTPFEMRNGRNRPNNGFNADTQRRAFYARMLKVSRLPRKRAEEEVEEDPYELMQVKTHVEGRNGTTHSDEAWVVVWVQPFLRESIKEVSVNISEFQKNNEWATMHSLDGKILASEHRAALFHGFMPSEVVGKMPYYFIAEDDLEIVLRSHQLIIADDEIPSTVWRMKTVMDALIYVQSRSIMVKDKWTKNPKNIVSVNEQLTMEEGESLMVCQRLRIEAAEKERDKQLEQIASQDGADSASPSSQESGSYSDSDTGSNSRKDLNGTVVRSSHLRHSIPNKKEVLEIHICTGKPLEEICTEEAVRYHDMYQKEQHSLSSPISIESSYSVKRTFDDSNCEDAGYKSPGESLCSQSSIESVFQLMDHSSSNEQSLPSSKSWSQERHKGTQSSCASSKPILKGLLEGRLNLVGENICTNILPHKMSASSAGDSGIDSGSGHSGDSGGDDTCSVTGSNSGSLVDDCLGAMSASCAGVTPPHDLSDIEAMDSLGPVQSPTIGSMGILDHLNASESPQFTTQFTNQLLLKYDKVKDTFSHHATTMNDMRAMFENTETVADMNPEQRDVFRQLIGQLRMAETQLNIQNDLLAEMEVEIGSQGNKLCTF